MAAALPVDAVVMGLHGASVAHGYDDVEGDLLRRVRDIVGPDVVVSAHLDPHSHLTDQVAPRSPTPHNCQQDHQTHKLRS